MKATFIDLFAGIGGTRIGFEQALSANGIAHQCVFTSEIKEHAIKAYQANFGEKLVYGDITKINPSDIPDFDYLLAGFPCQSFSVAGSRDGFLDRRGSLFFSIIDILKEKSPQGFLLENVEGLATINQGKTLDIVLKSLSDIGYKVNHKVLNAADFGVPQTRKRLYIIGDKDESPSFAKHTPTVRTAGEYIDYSAEIPYFPFAALLTEKFARPTLEGKSIKDKRGGENNIHSWDLELKGRVNPRQSLLLSAILRQRRRKKWAMAKGIPWMDGMPLTAEEIKTFTNYPQLLADLNYLEACGYLKFEHPKTIQETNGIRRRVYKTDAEKGYNIVSGKLSFPITKIIDPQGFVPTIVATEAGKMAVATDDGVRQITVNEGLSFSGFPCQYDLSMVNYKDAFDLLGNTVMPPVIKYAAHNLLETHYESYPNSISKIA